MVLVVGGTGALGQALTRRLLARGARVRVMTRRPEAAGGLAAAGAEVVVGDLVDRASLERACAGVDAVVAAAHSILGRGRLSSARVDGHGHLMLFDAARAAGVGHVVYTSGYDYGAAYRAVPFFRIKFETEARLQASGLPWTILRPTAFMETHAHLLIGAPVVAGTTVRLIGPGTWPRNFIAADDVAQVAVRALEDPGLRGRTIDIGGADHHSSLDVVRLYERVAGRTARVSHLPIGVASVLSRVLRPLHPGLSQILQTPVIASAHGERYAGAPLEASVGVTPVPLEEWVGTAV
jgi:NADH dehydrogenase